MRRLTLDNFKEEVLESEQPCMVLFKNSSCHLCRGFSITILPKLYRKYNKRIKFGIVDTIVESDLVDMFDIDGVPSIFLFDNGDGREIDYPDNPSPYSGYREQYVVGFLEKLLHNE